MSDVVVIADGVYRIGGEITLDGRYAGHLPHVRGYSPSNCYVILSADAAVLVDTGYTVHEEAVLSGLASLMRGRKSLSVFLTRAADFESLSNAASVLTEFPVTRVFSRQPAHWLIGFPRKFPPLPEEADASWPAGDIQWSSYAAGVPIEVDPAHPGERVLIPISASLRKTSSSSWLYDPASRTLFTGDCFGHVVRARPGAHCVTAAADIDLTTAVDVRDQLLAQFDWLASADAGTLRAGVAEVFAAQEVDVIAPGHGCILSGSEVVQRHVAMTLEVLSEFVPVTGAAP